MKTKTISKSNWKSHLCHSRRCLITLRQPNHQIDQNKLITKKLWIPMNPDMVLIGALKWRIQPSLYNTPVWGTWLNICWVKRKGCLKVQLTKILFFFIMMPCHLWQQRKIVSRWKKRDKRKCGSYLKWIYSQVDLSSNNTEIVHLGIAWNLAILIPVQTKIFTRQWNVMFGIKIHCIN